MAAFIEDDGSGGAGVTPGGNRGTGKGSSGGSGTSSSYYSKYYEEIYGEDAEVYIELADGWYDDWMELKVLNELKKIQTDRLNQIDTKIDIYWDYYSQRNVSDTIIDVWNICLATSSVYASPEVYVDAMISFDNMIGQSIKLDLERIGAEGDLFWTDKEIFNVTVDMRIKGRMIIKLEKKHRGY